MYRYRLSDIKSQRGGNNDVGIGIGVGLATATAASALANNTYVSNDTSPSSVRKHNRLLNRLNEQRKHMTQNSNALFSKTIGRLDVFVAPVNHLVPFMNTPPRPGIGSCFFIGPNAIMTADHVIKDAVKITMTLSKHPDGPKQFQCMVLYRFSDYDIAILGIMKEGKLLRGDESCTDQWIELDDGDVSIGQRVWKLGHPRGVMKYKQHGGTINGVQDSCYVFDCETTQGDSGGAVTRQETNKAIGVVSRGYLQENTNYAVPTASAIQFFEKFNLLDKCRNGGWCIPETSVKMNEHIKSYFESQEDTLTHPSVGLIKQLNNMIMQSTKIDKPTFPIVFRAPKLGLRCQPWKNNGKPCLRVRITQNRSIALFDHMTDCTDDDFFQCYGINNGQIIKTINEKTVTDTGTLNVNGMHMDVNDYVRTLIGENYITLESDSDTIRFPLYDKYMNPYISIYHDTRPDYEMIAGMIVKQATWEVLDPLITMLSLTKQQERLLCMLSCSQYAKRNDPVLIITEILPGCPFSPNVAAGDILINISSDDSSSNDQVKTLTELRAVIMKIMQSVDTTTDSMMINVETGIKTISQAKMNDVIQTEITMIQQYRYPGQHSTMYSTLLNKQIQQRQATGRVLQQ